MCEPMIKRFELKITAETTLDIQEILDKVRESLASGAVSSAGSNHRTRSYTFYVEDDRLYSEPVPDDGKLLTVAEFKSNADVNLITSKSGDGYPVKDNKLARSRPVCGYEIPSDATHIVWFSK